jgi:hypothetical protein
MAATPTIAVQITGKSDLQKIFGQTNKQMAAFQAHSQKTAAQITKITSIGKAGFAAVDKTVTSLVRNTFELFRNVSRIVDPLGIIAGAGTLAGLTALEAKFAQLGLSQVNTARGLNMSITSLSRWQGAAKIAGFSADTATDGIRATEEAMAGAKLGQNNGAAAYLNQLLGPGWKKMNDTQLLMAEAKKLQGLHGGALALAESNIGGALGQSQDFISFLAQGPAALQKQLGQAQNNGAMTGGQAGALAALGQGINSLEGAVEGFATSVTATLAPDITKALSGVTSWLDKNRSAITGDIKGIFTDAETFLKGVDWTGDWKSFKGAIKDVSDYLKGVDWKGDFKTFKDMMVDINGVVRSIGGWKPALEVLAGLFVVSKLAPVVGVFASMASFVASIGTGLAAIPALFPVIAAAIVGAGLADMFMHSSTAANDTMSSLPPNGSQGAPITPMQAGKNMLAASNQYRRIFGDSGAAAIMANIQAESAGNPNAVNPTSGAAGLFQMLGGEAADFKRRMGVDVGNATLQQQLDEIVPQLKDKYPALYKELQDPSISAEKKALDFRDQYERPILPANKGSAADIQDAGKRTLLAGEYFNGMPADSGGAPPGMGSEDRVSGVHTVNLNVTAPAGSKVTAKSSGAGQSIVKTVTAMPYAGRHY